MPPKKKQKVSQPRWEYQDDKTWTEYDAKDSALLEKAFEAKPSEVFTTTKLTFNKGFDTKYDFDFGKMTQRNADTKKVRKIRRAAEDDAAAGGDGGKAADKDYQWEWKDDTGVFVAFYDEDNDFIEKAYSKDPKSLFKTTGLSFNAEHRTPYVFDFKKMEQLNTESNTKRQLRRGKKAKAWDMSDYGTKADPKSVPVAAAAAAAAAVTSASAGTPMGDLSFPPYWTPKVAEVDLVDVDLKSDEAKDVLKTFHSTINRKVTVHSLQRIQNYTLWPFYALTRKAIADKNKGDPNEKKLFHGARVRANMDAITNFGFDMRVAATGLYGIGIYFAVNAKYSDSGYVLQNPDKSKEMFICRVTCGEHVPGNSALRRPPPKDTKVPNGALYDSVTDTGKPNIMHVVFNNAQAYPEYLVK
eukprot:EG_transcript_14461